MNEAYLKNVIEAALFAAGRRSRSARLRSSSTSTCGPSTVQVRAQLEALAEDYATRGIEMKETASGFRVQVRGAAGERDSRLWPERPPRFSRLLETLALHCLSTADHPRGNRGGARRRRRIPIFVKTLLERNWVRVVGQRDVTRPPGAFGHDARIPRLLWLKDAR